MEYCAYDVFCRSKFCVLFSVYTKSQTALKLFLNNVGFFSPDSSYSSKHLWLLRYPVKSSEILAAGNFTNLL